VPVVSVVISLRSCADGATVRVAQGSVVVSGRRV
jgi:hypothetical protein